MLGVSLADLYGHQEWAGALWTWARGYHARVGPFVAALTEERGREAIRIPWFPGLSLPVSEALAQAALHSHYHRGQNATRLRELGGDPPATDLIVWIAGGRPTPAWA